jgi:hypothetical protein
MRPLRSPPDDFEIRARARCRACGKSRELAGDELHGAGSMDTFKELGRRLRCTDCGERAVSVSIIPIGGADLVQAEPGFSQTQSLNAAPNGRIRNCRVTRQQQGWGFYLSALQRPDLRHAAY